MTMFARYERNELGRDLIVGDIHGHFRKLQAQLDRLGFDPARDRLFSVGDLVDRGPDCDELLDWLAKPWFFPVIGNHEDMAIRWPKGNMDARNYTLNGGAWNISNPPSVQADIAEALSALPLAIELDTAAGPIGIVHADCCFDEWDALTSVLSNEMQKAPMKAIREALLWSRERINEMDATPVKGIRAVLVGHTPVPRKTVLGNVHYIDAGAWHHTEKDFCIVDVETLEVAPPLNSTISSG